MLETMIPAAPAAGEHTDQPGYFQIGIIIRHVRGVMMLVNMPLFPGFGMCACECVQEREAEMVRVFAFEDGVMCAIVGEIERQQNGHHAICHITADEKRRGMHEVKRGITTGRQREIKQQFQPDQAPGGFPVHHELFFHLPVDGFQQLTVCSDMKMLIPQTMPVYNQYSCPSPSKNGNVRQENGGRAFPYTQSRASPPVPGKWEGC